MSKNIFILYPIHLFSNIDNLYDKKVYLLEDTRYFTDFKYHKLKLAYHRASMKKYFDNMMSIVDENSKLQKNSLVELMSDLNKIPAKDREKFKNNAGGYYNHSFFWNVMTTDSPVYSGAIKKLIDKEFGSLDKFKNEFVKTGMDHFGSGWVWLILKKGDKLKVMSTPNQDNPLMELEGVQNATPILGLDVWEHAYYLHYQNRRPDYIEAFFNVINWTEVTRRFVLDK